MIYIAHRGNTEGPTEFENRVEYLKHAYSLGHGIEFDVIEHNGKLYFGHDEPQENFDYELALMPNVFVHLKNLGAVELLAYDFNLNMFSHDVDECVMTSHGYVWGRHRVPVKGKTAVYLDFITPHKELVVDDVFAHCGDYYEG